jgi:hypothetical protein
MICEGLCAHPYGRIMKSNSSRIETCWSVKFIDLFIVKRPR